MCGLPVSSCGRWWWAGEGTSSGDVECEHRRHAVIQLLASSWSCVQCLWCAIPKRFARAAALPVSKDCRKAEAPAQVISTTPDAGAQRSRYMTRFSFVTFGKVSERGLALGT